MALTQISTGGIKDDAVTDAKLPANSVGNSEMKDDAVGVAELSASGTASSSTFLRGDNSWVTPTDTNTQLSTEEVQDIVGAMFTGNTETNITATYQDSDGTIDLVSTDTNTQLSTEEVQDIVGAMFTGNTETNITATYEDSDGTIDLVVGTSGAALTGSTNNTICTVTGADAIQGEANLTFDGNHLTQTIDADAEGITQTASGNHYIKNVVDANRSGTNAGILATTGKWNGKEVAAIKFRTGGDTTNKDDGYITFETSSANNIAEKLRIDSEGRVGIGVEPAHLTHIRKDTSGGAGGTKVVIENAATDSVNNNVELYLKTARGDFGFKHYNATESYIQVPDQLIINTNNATSATQALHIDTSQNVKVSNGNLVIGTSGKGIDFSTTSNSGGSMTSELLDDYETGTFTPTLKCASSDPTTSDITVGAHYIKIGKLVHIQLYFSRFDIDNVGSGTARLGGLPFNIGNLNYTPFGQCTHTNDKFASSKIPYAVYGRTNTDLLQFIEQNGSQINYSQTDSYYLGVSIQYYTD